MCLKSSCYQLKIDYYMFYVSLVITTRQNLTVDTQKIKRKESRCTIKVNLWIAAKAMLRRKSIAKIHTLERKESYKTQAPKIPT